jgi:hypothetical protein
MARTKKRALRMYMVRHKAYAVAVGNLAGSMCLERAPGVWTIQYFKAWHRRKYAQAWIEAQGDSAHLFEVLVLTAMEP